MLSALEKAIARVEKLPEQQQQVVSQALHTLLAEMEADSPAEAEAARPTGYELSRHLAGIFEGPSDLSSNPAYLEDLGEEKSP